MGVRVGWTDRVFRQQVALDRSLKWNTLHPRVVFPPGNAQIAGNAYNAEQSSLTLHTVTGSQLSPPAPSSSLTTGGMG